jgi:hypothetical protein
VCVCVTQVVEHAEDGTKKGEDLVRVEQQ